MIEEGMWVQTGRKKSENESSMLYIYAQEYNYRPVKHVNVRIFLKLKTI